jgi:HAD superfamily hydrolase (TIGR01459 family)
MKPAHRIEGLGEIAGNYDAMLCDVWGVVHDGEMAFPDACAAMIRFRAERGPILLLSNAPRPGEDVAEMLDRMSVPRDAYDGILTSGDATRVEMERRQRQSFHYIGPDRDRSVWAGLDVNEAAIADADFVLCTGLFDDERETPDDYAGRLAAMGQRGLPMICANPDIKVSRGPKLIWCAGALAEAYEKLGGEVVYFGKPHLPVYGLGQARLDEMAGKPVHKTRILAVGDGVRTDILGANRAGIDALLITSGIHWEQFGAAPQLPDASKVLHALEAADLFATAFQPHLTW